MTTNVATPTVRLVAISAGLGSPSSTRLLADRLIAEAERGLRDRGIEPEVAVIELRDHAVHIASHLVTGVAEPRLAAALEQVRRADGLIAVSPVFNGSYAGLFKSFFDLFAPDDLVGIPVALGATGGSARHSLVLEFAIRPLFTYLRTTPTSTAMFAATADWGGRDGRPGDLDERVRRQAGELVTAVAHRLGTTAASDPRSAEVAAPTIAATGDDFTAAARAERARREEHDGFAKLMSEYAHVPLSA